MRKILVLVLGLSLLAAACNKPQPAADNTNTTVTPTPAPTPALEPTPAPAPTPAPTAVEIKMTANGFEPSAVTVKKGGTVKFINNDSKQRWPASAPHPTHTDYPGFDPKKPIAAGESWSFTFDKTGKWNFHDHLYSTKFGSVTVVE